MLRFSTAALIECASRLASIEGIVRVADDPTRAVGSPIIAGVFLPDCWMEGVLSAGISKRWAAFDGELGRALGVR